MLFPPICKTALLTLLATTIAGSVLLQAPAQSAPAPAQPQAAPAKPAAPPAPPATYRLTTQPKRAHEYYGIFWGVDSLAVRQAESGELIRFSWRVLDPEKAKLLNDKKLEPSLFDLQAGVKLVVPQMEFVGQMRQTSTPIAGKSYWMAFSNAGRHVKRGDRVSVVIGQFHADGLLVE